MSGGKLITDDGSNYADLSEQEKLQTIQDTRELVGEVLDCVADMIEISVNMIRSTDHGRFEARQLATTKLAEELSTITDNGTETLPEVIVAVGSLFYTLLKEIDDRCAEEQETLNALNAGIPESTRNH